MPDWWEGACDILDWLWLDFATDQVNSNPPDPDDEEELPWDDEEDEEEEDEEDEEDEENDSSETFRPR